MSAVGIASLASLVSIVGAFLLHRVVLRILKDDGQPRDDASHPEDPTESPLGR